eukprot:10819409-Alexandrium_andersonii.AAC.1
MKIACGAWRASRTGYTFSTRTRMRCASSARGAQIRQSGLPLKGVAARSEHLFSCLPLSAQQFAISQ